MFIVWYKKIKSDFYFFFFKKMTAQQLEKICRFIIANYKLPISETTLYNNLLDLLEE